MLRLRALRAALERCVAVAFVAAIVLATLAPRAAAQNGPAQAGPAEARGRVKGAPHLDLRVEPFVDLYFYVRWLSEHPDAAPALDGLAQAVELARKLDLDLASPIAWSWIERRLNQVTSGVSAIEAFGQVPVTFKQKSDGPGERVTIGLRKRAVELARALAVVEPAFREQVWPAHRDEIAAARTRIETDFAPKERACFEFLQQHLGLLQSEQVIPLYLVAFGPEPDPFAHRDAHEHSVCFVSVHAHPGSQLYECMLHEAMHALDFASRGSVFDDLRTRLAREGYTNLDRNYRDVPHTLMFIQAGETIRRLVEKTHEDYGVVSGYYAKVEPIASIELETWKACLSGTLTRDKALETIIARVIAAHAK